jgi:iron complex outermembrane receptor protein
MSLRHCRILMLATAGLALPVSAGATEPARPGDPSPVALPQDIVVTGQQPASQASSGTKSDTPLAETAQSISVIDASTIADLGLQNLNQALRYVAGVTPETRGASAEVYDQFKLRGFDAPVYLDGLKMFSSASGYAAPQVDVSRLDRIEVVKGPASALYGASSPGGFIAEQSKLPLDRDFYGATSASYGTDQLYRVDADVGGRLGDGELWRVYGSVNGADDQQRFGKRRRETISVAGTAGAGSDTSFTVLAAYSHDPFNGNYGVFPTLGTLIDNPAGRISTRFYGGEPGDYFKRDQLGLTYIFRHDFGNGWSIRSSGRYQYVKSRLGIVYTSGGAVDPTDPAPTLYNRASYATREQLNDWTYDNQLAGDFTTGPLHHHLLIGVDRQVAHSRELYAFGSATPIDVFDPVYGTMPTPASPYDVRGYGPADDPGLADAFSIATQQRQQGIYAQDQIALGDLRVTISGRQDWARQASGAQVQHDRKFTWRAAALYKTAFGLSPYVSYSTSFEPQSSVLSDGSLAKPSLGRQWEAGAKYLVPGTSILLTGAWFDIHQTNVAVPDNNFSYYQAGRVRSRGVEIEASGSLPYGFNTRIAFSRQSVKVLDDVVAAHVGKPLDTTGRGGISANLEWAPKQGAAQGFAIGGTVRHVDSVYADYFTFPDGSSSALRSPAYTVFDASMRLDLARFSDRLAGVTLGVNATNLFDKRIITSCFAQYAWCWYGNRRTVQATIGVHW